MSQLLGLKNDPLPLYKDNKLLNFTKNKKPQSTLLTSNLNFEVALRHEDNKFRNLKDSAKSIE